MNSKEQLAPVSETDYQASSPSSDVEPSTAVPADSTCNDADDDDMEQATIAANATHSASEGGMKAVLLLRIALITVWSVAAVLASSGVFLYTSRAEEKEFRNMYIDYATKVLDTFQVNMEQSLYMIDFLSATYTSYSMDRNLTWPFVTLPNFEVLGVRARHLVQKSGVLVYAPLVSEANREKWEAYSVEKQGWTTEAIDYYYSHPELNIGDVIKMINGTATIPPVLWKLGENNLPTADDTDGPALPIWQFAPIGKSPFQVNFNAMSSTYLRNSLLAVIEKGEAAMSKFLTLGQDLVSRQSNSPISMLYYPVFQDFDDIRPRRTVGVIGLGLFWGNLLERLLPNNVNGIIAVLSNNCGQDFTLEVLGETSRYVGQGDSHDSNFDDMMEEMNLSATQVPGLVRVRNLGCPMSLRLYPSQSFRQNYITSKPTTYTVSTAAIFLFTAMVFLLYDWLVKRRHRVLKNFASRSNAIVTSLFPSMVRDRLLQNADIKRSDKPTRGPSNNDSPESGANPARRLGLLAVGFETPKIQLKRFLQDSVRNSPASSSIYRYDALPIADFFPSTTVLFADIAGFTAWCSQREPTQVFVLLETIYGAFDAIAKRLGVFKIETIGDCYMAVTGLPDPQEDHAVIMATFACACAKKVTKLTKKLEDSLGPGTSALSIRVGMHSGPVTAGVLRGQKSRFQLFGDTVNTASRMESNGQQNRVHLSDETAQLLVAAGKGHWIIPRDDVVVAKGLGEMKTYWMVEEDIAPTEHRRFRSASLNSGATWEASDGSHNGLELSGGHQSTILFERVAGSATEPREEKMCKDEDMTKDVFSRLVDFNVEILLVRLKSVVANQPATYCNFEPPHQNGECFYRTRPNPREEVVETITFPSFQPSITRRHKNPETAEISAVVVEQLRTYVASIAALYGCNPFHNFEHASHVTISSDKLLKHIISHNEADHDVLQDVVKRQRNSAVVFGLHESISEILSHPLSQFAAVFAALVHDVDHRGLTNLQLVQQQDKMAIKYDNKSVAEQNSITVALDLLMADDFQELRCCIYSTEPEKKLFRQLVVNSVMATDIFDGELRLFRKNRWEKAFPCVRECFPDGTQSLQNTKTEIHRKATSVMEHIIQVSDVIHTMQQWDVYQKWNRRLFDELFYSFQQGLLIDDPSLRWYEGELDFFDNYVIPQARKLKDCGVFGASCDDLLHFAQENRREWALKGRQIVESWTNQSS